MNKHTRLQISLPKHARLPINRCNLSADILGSLAYQQHPAPLNIDGVLTFYRDIFKRLQKIDEPIERSRHFMAFMSTQFQLQSPEEMGHQHDSRLDRSKATYLKLFRGWFFNTDSIEGAVLKSWVESRFGLLPRFHHTAIRSPSDQSYRAYEQERANGLYNTNALETKLDLLYSYCQLTLKQQCKQQTHMPLYRGCNSIDQYESFNTGNRDGTRLLLLNNLNSFSTSRERACEFGDHVIEVQIPIYKVSFYTGLLPGVLSWEDEYVVLGGLHQTRIVG